MNPGASPSRLTAQDVAYAQYALELRAGNDREDMWERLALANERETPDRERMVACDSVYLIGAIGVNGTCH